MNPVHYVFWGMWIHICISAWALICVRNPPVSLRLSFTSPPMSVFGERLPFILCHPAWAGIEAPLLPPLRHSKPPL
jgi:hypothetical protein